MSAERVAVKVYAEPSAVVDLDAVVPLFHRWIQDQLLDDLLIDVADYRHVHHGPGILLVGHAADYGVDLSEGRTGLLFTRKRGLEGDVHAQLDDAIDRALAVSQRLTDNLGFAFQEQELLIQISDRLQWPNEDASFESLEPHLIDRLTKLGRGEPTLVREGSNREPLRIRAHFASA